MEDVSAMAKPCEAGSIPDVSWKSLMLRDKAFRLFFLSFFDLGTLKSSKGPTSATS